MSATKIGLKEEDATIIGEIYELCQASGVVPPDLGYLLDSEPEELASLKIDIQRGKFTSEAFVGHVKPEAEIGTKLKNYEILDIIGDHLVRDDKLAKKYRAMLFSAVR
jgi:hypothetical protein